MATIYLSSTYEDLKDYRRVVYEAVRKSGHQVIAMEDYVARDQRPLESCLQDVRSADLYVGLFAFRYGYIPPSQHDNPNDLSITELEFREAKQCNKPCLIFLASKDARPELKYVDACTGEGGKGERINILRQYLLTERMVSEFSAPHELSTLVLAAIMVHLEKNQISSSLGDRAADASVAITWNIQEKGSPYPGLMHFTRKYAPVFFGRDADVREILDRMRLPEGRFIIVSGDSGSGKSSVIDAGVLPEIDRGSLLNSKQALCVGMLPSQGRHPFGAFMGALNPFATQAGLRPDEVAEELIQSPDRLSQYVQKILAENSDRQALVLFLDQMEELFTVHTPTQSGQFLHALYQAAQDVSMWVLATIRSDHLDHCHRHPAMLRVLRGPGHYPLGPIEQFILPDLIAKPAVSAGLCIGDNLVRRIVHETISKDSDGVRPDQSNLPFLAFVMDQLFDKRVNQELSERVYEDIGGVEGAIAHHASQVETDLHSTSDGKASELLHKLFESLVIVNAEGLPTRRRPLVAEFSAEMLRVIEVLVKKRLLLTEGQGGQSTASISHEKLFDAWPALKDYVAKNKKELMNRSILESRARKWEEMGRPRFSGLASGRECLDYYRTGVAPSPKMKDYLSASRQAYWFFNGMIALVLLLIGGMNWLWHMGYDVNQAKLKVQSLVMSIHREPEMVQVEGGTFQMGDAENLGDKWRIPEHSVKIKSFRLGKFEVTFDEYDRFAIAKGLPLPNDQDWGRGSRPVINVSWEKAKAYGDWLSKTTGKHYRLPTEAEWEYAARFGAKQEARAGRSDAEHLGEYAVIPKNSENKTAITGTKLPNDLGLHDMRGNVYEWVGDCVHEKNKDVDPSNGSAWPSDGSAWLGEDGGDCTRRILRGGSWASDPMRLPIPYRFITSADNPNNDFGFRLAQDIGP